MQAQNKDALPDLKDRDCVWKWQGQKGSNPRPAVLETAALPTELYPYVRLSIPDENLFIFTMQRMLATSATGTVFFQFHATLAMLTMLRGSVVSTTTLGAGHSDDDTSVF